MKHRHPTLIKKSDGFVHWLTDDRGVKRGKVIWYAPRPNKKRREK